MDINETNQQMMHNRLTALELFNNEKVPHYFDSRRMEMRFTEPSDEYKDLSPIEIALLTIQENGCAPNGFGVVTQKPEVIMPFYVAGYDSTSRHLIVGTALDTSDNSLYGLGKLLIKDLVGYKTIQDLRTGALKKLNEIRQIPISLS